MVRTRLAHRLVLLSDRDVLHSLVVAATACVASAGLAYAFYLVHVLRVARNAPVEPVDGRRVPMFGKHAPRGVVDHDLHARVQRAAALSQARRPDTMPLLAGERPHRRPRPRWPVDAPLVVEDRSRDTLENLRNARVLMEQAAVPTCPRSPCSAAAATWRAARCSATDSDCIGNCARRSRRCNGGRASCGASPARRGTCTGWISAGVGCG